MTAQDVADEASRELEAAALGTVVAVWRGSEVSTHRPLATRRRVESTVLKRVGPSPGGILPYCKHAPSDGAKHLRRLRRRGRATLAPQVRP